MNGLIALALTVGARAGAAPLSPGELSEVECLFARIEGVNDDTIVRIPWYYSHPNCTAASLDGQFGG